MFQQLYMELFGVYRWKSHCEDGALIPTKRNAD